MTDLGYKYTKPRVPIGAMYTSPGPIYMLPTLIGEKNHDTRSTHPKAPAYSLGKPLEELTVERSPGPAAYAQNSKLSNTGEAYSPKYTITGIQKPLKLGQRPGPADYDVQPAKKVVFPGIPAYPMGTRLKELKTDDKPAPNAYSLPPPSTQSDIVTAPKYTMAGRQDGFIITKVSSEK
uniref:Outer dense fiber protein 3 n=1 Tax=Trichobilharzia regenti TaxID=157069 RepID=A0AA85J4D7_TRIRE|nr:unnamed protein product [Trichobilharzia regenti]